VITPSVSNCKAPLEQGHRKRYPLTVDNLICFASEDTVSVTRFQRAINLVLEAMILGGVTNLQRKIYLKLEAKTLEGLPAYSVQLTSV
jgi:hypothetical protein